MKKRWSGTYTMVLIAACGIIGASIGILMNTRGVFLTPLADYYSVGRGVISLAMTILSFTFAFGGMISLKVFRPSNFKKMGLMIALLISGLTLLMGVVPNLVLYFVLSAVIGFLGGIDGSVLATVIINYWFLENTGLFTSISFGISGIMGALLSPVFNKIILSAGWQRAYVVMAVILLGLLLLPVILPVSMRPHDMGMQPYGVRAEQTDSTNAEQTEISRKNVVLVMILASAGAVTTALPTHFTGIAETAGFSASVGAFMISLCMIMNTVGKVLFGTASDRVGVRRTTVLFLGLTAVGIVLAMISRSVGLMYVASILIGLSYAIGAVGSVIATREVFGSQAYAVVYPKVALTTTVMNAASTFLAGVFYDASGSYFAFLILLLVMAVGGIYATLALPERRA